MLKICAATIKELLLLLRDRTGLLVLFLMPGILVVVITLVQENVMELTGQKETRVLFLDLDQGDLGRSLREKMAAGNLRLVEWDGEEKDGQDVEAAVAAGSYQLGIVIPPDASARFAREAARLFQQGMARENPEDTGATSLQLFVDPGTMAGFRSGVVGQLRMALQAIALEAKLAMLAGALRQSMTGPAQDEGRFSAFFSQPLLVFAEKQDGSASAAIPPYNPVQQNVPAWALFGIFFTAIPVAGSILQERGSGIWVRLAVLPVSPFVLFAGKAAAYIGVCLCQFLLIALIGAFLFPHLGLPAFTIAMHPAAVLLTVLLSGLAACGYGILLGMTCNSYEQASTVGATTVVAAAAIGGVMVPVYAMPQVMQDLSVISPLNWGLTACNDLLLRGYSLADILDDLGRLLLFFLATAFFSWKFSGIRQ